ncbi:MAG TPA: isocitrate lyase/phosphoenolpyruvate mutase family protein [Candidatus Polarisedimenticolaceae bacterium]|nr:isocitrate lyase/phosphoenolpyruvate mutase family protein [Candidatus Polarisedimenticolaceae bacterium]
MSRRDAVAAFRALHASGCFVLPNPWDVGTALHLAHLGFRALATTSAGFAFSRGLPDDPSALSCKDVLVHVREIADATPLPVNADFQSGYADDAEGVGTNVARCVAAGCAGLSIEDASGDAAAPLFPLPLALERLRAARSAIDAAGIPVVLTARCEAWLVGDPDPLRTARERLAAFAADGADCLYAPGVRRPEEIEALVREVAPKPLNVLVHAGNAELTMAQLTDLGVRRISVGSSLARVAWGAFLRSAREIAATGSFESFLEAARSPDPDGLFRPGNA